MPLNLTIAFVYYTKATIAVIVISLFGVAQSAHANESIRDTDFNNFTYPIRSGGIGPSGEISLSQGEYRDGYSGVRLGRIQYADLNGDEIEDALVLLLQVVEAVASQPMRLDLP